MHASVVVNFEQGSIFRDQDRIAKVDLSSIRTSANNSKSSMVAAGCSVVLMNSFLQDCPPRSSWTRNRICLSRLPLWLPSWKINRSVLI
jgi:hypothetical protein